MKSTRDGDAAIRDLDRREWGYKRRPLRVEWSQKSEDPKAKEQTPSCALFIVNFDVHRAGARELGAYFERCVGLCVWGGGARCGVGCVVGGRERWRQD